MDEVMCNRHSIQFITMYACSEGQNRTWFGTMDDVNRDTARVSRRSITEFK
jgi:hypothetical protein